MPSDMMLCVISYWVLLPAEVAVLRAVGRAALRQKIGERAAEFLLREKRGELRAARVV